MSYFETVRCELLMYFDVVISIALKRLWQRKRIVVLCVIMMAGALGLTATVVSLRKLANKARSTISDSLSGALSCYGEINIEMQGLSSDEKGEIFESIINLPSIKSIGSISELFVFNLRDENGKSDTWKCIRKEQINHPLVFSETKLDLPEGIASSYKTSKGKQPVIDKTSELYEQSMELENYLVKMMLSSARNTIQKSSLLGDDNNYARDMYEDMMYDNYAESLTKNAHFGLADQIYIELSGQR